MGISIPVVGVPDVLDGGASLDFYLSSLGDVLYYKFNEASGNLIDYGSEGADGAVTSATQGQAGIAGLGAYLYDGVDDLVTVTNASLPTVKALTTQRWGWLTNLDSLGESNVGIYHAFDTAAAGNHYITFASSARIQAAIDTDATNATSVSGVGEANQFTGGWAWLFMDYDHADALGGGRVIRLFCGKGGTVTELTYGTQTAATGTVTSQVNNLIVGNNSSGARTQDGKYAVGVCQGALWTTAVMQQLVNLAGV
jgi:hypothetical protein